MYIHVVIIFWIVYKNYTFHISVETFMALFIDYHRFFNKHDETKIKESLAS